jgi:hypothetical protein
MTGAARGSASVFGAMKVIPPEGISGSAFALSILFGFGAA